MCLRSWVMSLFVKWWVMFRFIAVWKLECVEFIISMFMDYIYVCCISYVYIHLFYVYVSLWVMSTFIAVLKKHCINFIMSMDFIYVCCIVMSTFICFMFTFIAVWKLECVELIISMFMDYIYVRCISYVYVHLFYVYVSSWVMSTFIAVL